MEYSICGCLRCMPLWLFPTASCFVCFSINVMFYGPEQLKCFPMPTMRFQHWVFLHRTFSWICRIYIYDCYNFVLFCVYKFEHLWFRCVRGAFYHYQMPTVEIHILWDGARLVWCFPIARIITYLQYCYGIFNLIIPLLCVLHVILLL
jgi:hypothetical protein